MHWFWPFVLRSGFVCRVMEYINCYVCLADEVGTLVRVSENCCRIVASLNLVYSTLFGWCTGMCHSVTKGVPGHARGVLWRAIRGECVADEVPQGVRSYRLCTGNASVIECNYDVFEVPVWLR